MHAHGQHNSSSSSGACLTIDLSAIASNYRLLKARVGPTEVAGVVKADGYGLGATRVVQTLLKEGCRHFFVGLLDEARELTSLIGNGASIYVLNGLPPGAEQTCINMGAVPVLSSLPQLERWQATAKSRGIRIPAVIQVDTGMSRMGLSPDEVDKLVQLAPELNNLDVRFIMSHLACADDVANPANASQLRRFKNITARFPDWPASLDNSAGCFHDRDHFDLVRPGIALYGGAPTSNSNPMQPVIRLEAKIIQIRTVDAGTRVGYGLTFSAGRKTRIATVSVGYADGWPRQLSNRGNAYIGGLRVPIAGRISMDCITLDVTDVPDELLHEGAFVEFVGPHQCINTVARDAGTISYELLTQLSRRYERVYLPVTA